jgi:hypothetical protein
MEEILKNKITGLYKLVSIKKEDYDLHKVTYIELSYKDDKSPVFQYTWCRLDLRQDLREFKINELLNNEEPKSELQLDESLYNDQQLEKINKLRFESKNKKSKNKTIKDCRIEWANQFKVGDTVYYKGRHAIITFKHQMKSDLQPQEWSVKTGNTEYRYVTGALLRPRKIEDLSYITLNKELDKLPTERLLKMYKRSLKVNKGIGNKAIKRILKEKI